MSAAEEDSVVETPAPKSTTNKILPIILVVNTLLMTGVLIFVMKRPSAQAAAGGGKEHSSSPKEHEEPAKKAEGEGEGHDEGGEQGAKGDGAGPILRLDNFIVQVQGTEGDRYAHMTIEVELGAEADKKAFESRMPHIRDGVIGYLADRNEDELRGSEGLTAIKEALLKKLGEIVPGRHIRGLFVTEFIFQ